MTPIPQVVLRTYSIYLFQDDMMALPPSDAANMFYNDLEREESRQWTALLKPQSVGYALFSLSEHFRR